VSAESTAGHQELNLVVQGDAVSFDITFPVVLAGRTFLLRSPGKPAASRQYSPSPPASLPTWPLLGTTTHEAPGDDGGRWPSQTDRHPAGTNLAGQSTVGPVSIVPSDDGTVTVTGRLGS